MNATSTSLEQHERGIHVVKNLARAAVVSKTGWACHVSGYLDALSRGIRKNGDRRM
jgi:hypothetical protein